MATLFFLLTFFVFIFCLVLITYYVFQKRKKKAKRVAIVTIGIGICYSCLLLIFSLTSQSKVLPYNQDKCFDDWCVMIINLNKESSANTIKYLVTLKVSNHARGRAQKPDNPVIYTVDDQGNKYFEEKTAKIQYEKLHGLQRLIKSRIDPQSNYETTMIFVLPKNKKGYLVISEGGFPTRLIIDDEGSWLHKKSVTPLD